MQRRLIAGTTVGVMCMCVGVAVRAQTPAATYPFGAVVITVPAPADYVALSSDDLKLRESLVSPMGGRATLAFYVPATSSPPVRQIGKPQELESFAMLSTSPDARVVDVGADDFRAMATRVRTGLDEKLRQIEPDLATAVAEIGKRMQTDIGLQRPAIVGVFDDAVDRIGVLLVTPFTVGGSTISMLSANTLIRVRSRVLFAYVYTPNVQPEALTALVSVARSWTDAIFAANGEAVPRRPQ